MMRGTTPSELDGATRGDLSIRKVCILGVEIDEQLTHGERKGAVVILSLRFGGPEEADYAMRIKGISGSTQAPFRQAGFLRPFCWRDAKKGGGAHPSLQALLWRSSPRLRKMIVCGSVPAFPPG